MATTTTKTTTKLDAATAVREAEAQVTALRGEVAMQRALASGTVETPTTRQERRQYVTQTGAVAEAVVDAPHIDIRHVGPLERLKARRQLADAEDRLALAEEALEVAKAAAAVAARTQRAEGIAAGEAVLRRLLPDLLRDVRALQTRVQSYYAELERLDAPIQAAYFTQLAGCPVFLPGQLIDLWLAQIAAAFPPERR